MAAGKEAYQVHCLHAGERFGRDLGHRPACGAHPGVVAEHVQPAMTGDYPVDHLAHRVRVAHVQRHDFGRAGQLLNLGGNRGQSFFVARRQDHVRSGARESQRDLAPDPPAGAGDQSRSIREVHQGQSPIRTCRNRRSGKPSVRTPASTTLATDSAALTSLLGLIQTRATGLGVFLMIGRAHAAAATAC